MARFKPGDLVTIPFSRYGKTERDTAVIVSEKWLKFLTGPTTEVLYDLNWGDMVRIGKPNKLWILLYGEDKCKNIN